MFARVLGVLISEMAISESYGKEFRRGVEWWGERRERNHSRDSELSAKFRLRSGHARNIAASLWSGCSVATCRRQNRNVLEFLTACCQARLNGSNAPTLLPSEAASAAAA